MDSLLTRYDLARYETESVGAGLHNFHLLTTLLLRQLEPSPEQPIQLLQPLGGLMPTTQIEYDTLVFRIRQMGHILEASPNNITNGFNRRSRDNTVALTDATEQVYMFGTGFNANSGSSQAAYTAYTPAQTQGGWGSWTPAQPQGTIFGETSGGHGNATPEYTYYGGDGGDSSHAGTDSDTESSCGEEDTRPEGLSAQLNGPLSHLPDAEKEQHLYWAYKTTKGNWRKFMRKPVRKVRRYFRKEAEGGWKGKGKGQSKSKGKRLSGKGISAYVAELSDEAYEETFFGKGKGKGRGKGKGKRSSGKGMGSRKESCGPRRNRHEVLWKRWHVWQRVPPQTRLPSRDRQCQCRKSLCAKHLLRWHLHGTLDGHDQWGPACRRS